jgi:hypothetical protein
MAATRASGDLLGDVQSSIVIAGFLGQEQNDFIHSCATAGSTIGFCLGKEVRGLYPPNVTPRAGDAILQDLCESNVAADESEHGRRGWIGERRLRTGRRATPEHGVGPRRRCGSHRSCGLEARFGQVDLPILGGAQRR